MYNRVYEKFVHEVIVKKSRFITTLIPIDSAEQAESELRTIRKFYSDATHNCYAYISNEIATEQRFGDDGEPQGTAGLPILEVLKKRDIRMTLVVVTRYFGGIKLGAGGLVGAYSDSASKALDNADVRKYIDSVVVDIKVNYGTDKKVVEIIKLYGKIIEVDYSDNVTIRCALPVENSNTVTAKIIDITLGNATITELNISCIDYITE